MAKVKHNPLGLVENTASHGLRGSHPTGRDLMINATQTIQDLRNAIDYMSTHGWVQGYDFGPQGGCCAFGAIRAVVGDDGPHCSEQTRERASNAARAFYRVFAVDITSYNDATDRTQDQVIQAIETVIATLEKDPSRA